MKANEIPTIKATILEELKTTGVLRNPENGQISEWRMEQAEVAIQQALNRCVHAEDQ